MTFRLSIIKIRQIKPTNTFSKFFQIITQEEKILRVKNAKYLYLLQFFLDLAIISNLKVSLLYYMIICEIYVLLKLFNTQKRFKPNYNKEIFIEPILALFNFVFQNQKRKI